MRLAILSDVHGNSIALDAVLADVSAAGGVDEYWVLGDHAALGPDPTGTIERLMALPNARFVRGNIDPWPVVASYVGLALSGAMFLAIGMLVSSLVRSQMVAALITVVLSLLLVITGFWQPQQFSQDFGRGIIDTRYVVFYVSTAVFCLFLTVRSLESRRWR